MFVISWSTTGSQTGIGRMLMTVDTSQEKLIHHHRLLLRLTAVSVSRRKTHHLIDIKFFSMLQDYNICNPKDPKLIPHWRHRHCATTTADLRDEEEKQHSRGVCCPLLDTKQKQNLGRWKDLFPKRPIRKENHLSFHAIAELVCCSLDSLFIVISVCVINCKI